MASGHGATPAASLAPRIAPRRGLASNLGNPKIAISYISFLPQFVPAGQDAFAHLLLLGLIFAR